MLRMQVSQTVGLFMIEMPGETPEMTRETVDFLAIWNWILQNMLLRFRFLVPNSLTTDGKRISLGMTGKTIQPSIQIQIVWCITHMGMIRSN